MNLKISSQLLVKGWEVRGWGVSDGEEKNVCSSGWMVLTRFRNEFLVLVYPNKTEIGGSLNHG